MLGACGGSAPASPSYAESPTNAAPPVRLDTARTFFVPGEQMTWKVSVRGIGGGAAVMVVGHPGRVEGKPRINVRSRVASTGIARMIREVSDDVLTQVDLDTGLPVHYEAELKFGRKQTSLETQFGYGSFYVNWQRKGKPGQRLRQRLPHDEHAHNAHSLLGALRAWTPNAGARAYAYVLSGRRLWRTDLQFVRREVVRTEMGSLPALRFEGYARRMTGAFTHDKRKKPRSFTVWIADDATRAPLLVSARTEYGKLRVELTEYEYPPEAD